MNRLTGLTDKIAQSKLKKFGYNEIAQKETSSLRHLLKKLWAPIPWMIESAAILSAIAHKWEDFFIIILLLTVNVFVDYHQESKANSALEILKRKLAKKALVRRNGVFKVIDARELVPDDIIKLKIGNIVPADAKLLVGDFLEIDQSVLTGESMPVDKKIGDEVYSNSIVKKGEMLAQVTRTGQHTFFGKSALLVKKAESEKFSHFQKAVIRIGNFLIISTLFLAFIILVVSTLRHHTVFQEIQFILILIIASIPVALPTVLSVTMAVGAIAIAKKQAVVSDLPAIEELASVDILCSDKTGTLTQNNMALGEFINYEKFNEKDLFTYAFLSSEPDNQDSLEKPIIKYFNKNFSDKKITEFKLHKFIPFDSEKKRTEAIVSYKKDKITITKGAPQIIANLCGGQIKKKLTTDVNKFAKKGYRTIAVAIKKGEKGKWNCVGLISLFDPPRVDSAKVIKKLKKMGIKIKMLTGDNNAIAIQIAKLLKIGTKIVDSVSFKKIFRQKLREDKNIKKLKTDLKKLDKIDGFSQIWPEDKYYIIQALKKTGHITAMTGDGVNDAPALKKADVGIAVSGATDAARAAADLILLSPGLSVINTAIKIARQTFQKMKAYAIFRVAETIRIILFITFSIVIFDFYPITAVMIIILSLLNDIPVMMLAYDNTIISKKPTRWQMKEVIVLASVLGFLGVVSSGLFFSWLYLHNYPLALIQTMLFIKLDVAGHSTLYLIRTADKHFWKRPYPSLKFFIPTFLSRIVGTLIAVYGIFMTAIGWKYAIYIWIYALTWWVFNDFVKVLVYKILNKHN